MIRTAARTRARTQVHTQVRTQVTRRVRALVAVLALASGGPLGASAVGPVAAARALAPSTTTVVLSASTSNYGDTVTATAQVVTSGPADGDVYFTLDGTSTKANVSGGLARLTLPRTTAVGEHAVSASFVPRLPGQDPSTSAPTTWVVTRATTFLQARVTGRGAHVPTGVVLGAVGDWGTHPTGSVTLTARHLATGKVTRRVRTLDPSGAATASFGILRTGTYRLRVSYAGDAQHLAARYSAKFSVTQR